MSVLRGLCIGAGYFAQYHFDGWRRIDEVRIVGVCDKDQAKARQAAATWPGTTDAFDCIEAALNSAQPDFVDLITPPESHYDLVAQCAAHGLHIICQKPLAPDFATAEKIVQSADDAKVRLMVHENFRFQPWHREIKRLLDADAIGRRLHSLTFRTRTGDGWGDDAYSARQPYFREMPRLLIQETGVHFVDVFRYLAGPITEVNAVLRRLNPVIKGEDTALVTFRFASDAIGVWDANRYNESTAEDPRLTFGEFLVEGDDGSLRLYSDGRLTIQPLGEPEQEHFYAWRPIGFAGDCVYRTQRHFIDCLQSGAEFETNGKDYLEVLRTAEAIYDSDRLRRSIALPTARATELIPCAEEMQS